MTHSLDLASVDEKLFLIQQLVAASKDYCKFNGVSRRGDKYERQAWEDYAFRLKQLVSTYAIECSVKTRMLQDALSDYEGLCFDQLDREAREGLVLGEVHLGKFDLTVREACNKVIHATKVEFGWSTSRLVKPNRKIEYWDGSCHLHGRLGKSQWHVQLNMWNWAAAVDAFLDLLSGSVDFEDFPLD